jgi:tight adherence protein B
MPIWLVCALAFVGILAIALLVVFAPSSHAARSQRQARLEEISRYRMAAAIGGDAVLEDEAPQQSAFATRALAVLDKRLRARGKRAQIASTLERSGMRMRPEEWVAIQIIAVIIPGVLLAVLVSNIVGLIIGAALGWGLCRFFLKFKISRRMAAFESQLPDALQLLAGALRSGFALNQSIAGLVREGTEPVAGEFSRAMTEVRLGADLETALEGIADRMESYDMRLVCMSIRTAREVGGNLAEVLSTTVETMRERAQLRGQVKVLSAEGRTSAKVLAFMPFGLAAYMQLTKPGYLDALFTSFLGIAILAGGAVLLTAGLFWISRIVKIEV